MVCMHNEWNLLFLFKLHEGVNNKLVTTNPFTQVHLRDVLAPQTFSTQVTATHRHPCSFTLSCAGV